MEKFTGSPEGIPAHEAYAAVFGEAGWKPPSWLVASNGGINATNAIVGQQVLGV
jgi:hypothetical protein